MKFFHCIPLRVHCWGGLGSQLYALSVAYDLKLKYPKRKIKLVLHTGGVTKRLSELDFIHNIEFKITQKNDFQTKDNEHQNQMNSNKISLRKFFVNILYFFKFIVSANSNSDFDNVRPWTVSTRGHYFNRDVSANFYSYLLKHFNLEKQPLNRSQFQIAIHYRMGDLLSLRSKSVTSAEEIINAIRQVQKGKGNVDINVFSDSPQIARETLSSAGLTDVFEVEDLPTIDVIQACIVANFFIGTGSKVSLWIINIRRYLGVTQHVYLEGFDSMLYQQT